MGALRRRRIQALIPAVLCTIITTLATAFSNLPPVTTAVTQRSTSTTTSLSATNTVNNEQEVQEPQPSEVCQEFPATSSSTTMTTQLRSVRKIMARPPAHWVGDGFRVYPVFASSAFTEEISPLLMFDYAEPKKFPPRAAGASPLGVGQHPHRGFETVTVAFQGEVEHQDSTGKKGVIGQGDVQWMTAGRGIIHQEFHSHEFTKSGGTFEMCQLWVNLPKKYKMTKPGYQEILKEDIPTVDLPLTSNNDAESNEPLGTARIIAGELGDTKGAASTFSPVQMWDVNLFEKGTEVDIPFPADHNCMVFVRRGAVQVVSGESNSQGTNGADDDNSNNKQKVKKSDLGPQDVALLRIDGSETVRLRVMEPDSSVMILGGEPLNEQIAAQGPFVMNTKDEIHQAISDYRLGKMGR